MTDSGDEALREHLKVRPLRVDAETEPTVAPATGDADTGIASGHVVPPGETNISVGADTAGALSESVPAATGD